MKREDWIQTVRGWVGTPFALQQAVKGEGCDCVGLFAGALAEHGVHVAYARDYGLHPSAERVLRDLRRSGLLERTGAGLPGDLLLLRIARDPQHLALLSSETTMIHALPHRGVVEVTYTPEWRERTLGTFKFVFFEN